MPLVPHSPSKHLAAGRFHAFLCLVIAVLLIFIAPQAMMAASTIPTQTALTVPTQPIPNRGVAVLFASVIARTRE